MHGGGSALPCLQSIVVVYSDSSAPSGVLHRPIAPPSHHPVLCVVAVFDTDHHHMACVLWMLCVMRVCASSVCSCTMLATAVSYVMELGYTSAWPPTYYLLGTSISNSKHQP
jgi:hypothetical protein